MNTNQKGGIMPKDQEEQITHPGLDTKLGICSDNYAKSYEKHIKAAEALEKAGEEMLKQMKADGVAKCACIGREKKVTLTMEYVKSHEKLTRTVSSAE